MHIKTHIAFISLIVLVIFLIWKMLDVAPTEKPPLVISGYAIEIVRASYGLECSNYVKPDNSDPYAVGKEKETLRENNVLTQVSNRCNGQVKCTLTADKKDYSEDTVSCSVATLQVEYRCFMLDRLRKSTAKGREAATIDCSDSQ